MKNFLFLITTALLATGCATTVPMQAINPGSSAALQGQSLALTTRPKPFFSPVTLGKVMLTAPLAAIPGLGVLAAGAIAGATAGVTGAVTMSADQIRSESIPDTSAIIAGQLAAALEAKNGMVNAGGGIKAEANTTHQEIAEAARGHAKYVLDVETVSLLVSYFPTDWTHYDVRYRAVGRLIDADTGLLVASATCEDLPDNKAIAPSYDALMANNAAVMKQMLEVEAAACVATLKRDMFQM